MSPWNDQRQLNEVNYNKTFSFVKPMQYGQQQKQVSYKNNNDQSGQILAQVNPPQILLGYQYEQWQRPPSRQKEPNQALGLDDARPKTRGNNQCRSLGGTTIITLNFMVS